jgi:hypothetical protein
VTGKNENKLKGTSKTRTPTIASILFLKMTGKSKRKNTLCKVLSDHTRKISTDL